MILQEVIQLKRKESSKTDFSIVPDTTQSTALSDLMAAAKIRAQSKNDSLNAHKEENARLTQTAEVRRDRLMVAAQNQQKREQNRAEESRRRAQQELITIYSLIEKGLVEEASAYLEKVQDLLKENLPDGEFDKITLSVDRKRKK